MDPDGLSVRLYDELRDSTRLCHFVYPRFLCAFAALRELMPLEHAVQREAGWGIEP
jgi:hypothetical protein